MLVFWFLVVLVVVVMWFLLSFLYKPLGRFFKRLFADSVDAMTTDDPKDTIYNQKKKEMNNDAKR